LLTTCPRCKSKNAGEYCIGIHQLRQSLQYTYWCACRDCKHRWTVSLEARSPGAGCL